MHSSCDYKEPINSKIFKVDASLLYSMAMTTRSKFGGRDLRIFPTTFLLHDSFPLSFKIIDNSLSPHNKLMSGLLSSLNFQNLFEMFEVSQILSYQILGMLFEGLPMHPLTLSFQLYKGK